MAQEAEVLEVMETMTAMTVMTAIPDRAGKTRITDGVVVGVVGVLTPEERRALRSRLLNGIGAMAIEATDAVAQRCLMPTLRKA